MPRTARLDVLGVLQHVMARGIDGYAIFQDERDRKAFLERLAGVVEWARADLLAWCLMSNHFHLLVRPREVLLAPMMRRLMTGYAVWHNRRHGRRGHVFQNRYKSIVVEEEPYFLELVRYIHLNPVRAGLVASMEALDEYPYTGHAVLLRSRELACQNVDEVLRMFGRRMGEARKGYRAFVEAGFSQGRREELRGGGLVRSAGGWKNLLRRKREEREPGDERILGGGEFVRELLERAGAPVRRSERDVLHVLEEVCREHGIGRELVLGRTRRRGVVRAREAFFLRAHEEAGESFASLGRLCGMSHTAVRAAIRRARQKREAGTPPPPGRSGAGGNAE
ncbi:transposase [Deferrisoma camini]|uniref:transposase n=1 Tax=Deferrisoma camini TaxID=1035120 RepID=UPI00046D02F3|nr:transposase [Deferrisoma camini]